MKRYHAGRKQHRWYQLMIDSRTLAESSKLFFVSAGLRLGKQGSVSQKVFSHSFLNPSTETAHRTSLKD